MTVHLLLTRAGSHTLGLPLEHVDETMRPLPVQLLPGVPGFVKGASIVRGAPTPIADLRTLLGCAEPGPPRRLVTLKLGGDRRAGLLVDSVLGVLFRQDLPEGDLPPLLRDAAAAAVERLAMLDEELLIVLRASSLLPEGIWQRLAEQETG